MRLSSIYWRIGDWFGPASLDQMLVIATESSDPTMGQHDERVTTHYDPNSPEQERFHHRRAGRLSSLPR